MADMTWDEAIIAVFQDNLGIEMTNGDIAQNITDKRYRTKVGATPQNTIGARMSSLMERHDIERIDRGVYILRPQEGDEISNAPLEDPDSQATTIKIEAYGIHWERSKVHWQGRRILGYDTDPRETIDFANQQGVSKVYMCYTIGIQWFM